MAAPESSSSSSSAEQLLPESENKAIAVNISFKIPRRKVTLTAITVLLDVLLWSSLVCLVIAIFQIASDSEDDGNTPSGVLTLTAALVTVSYTFLHTIISLKQRIWTHQPRHRSAVKRMSYVAIRMVISSCVLWLLTCGWNMIIIARRPVCLPDGQGLQAWEAGTTCRITRLGMAFAMIALTASCALFGMLAVVSRPFEAHIFKHGYQKPSDVLPTPYVSRRPSQALPVSYASEKCSRGRRILPSSDRSLDLGNSPRSSTIYAPSPIHSLNLVIFTCDDAPPAIPAAHTTPPRESSLEPPPIIFHPSVSHHSFRPPRLSGLVSSSGFVPLSITPEYSPSAWQAVHPTSPPVIHPASRSQPHLPSARFSYRHRYSRSSVSLTKPHRLSSGTPAGSIGWSSRSSSTGPEGGSISTSGEENSDRRASAYDIAFATQHGTPIPGTTRSRTRGKGHLRTSSAPDATSGDQQTPFPDRMAMGWKPQSVGQATQSAQSEGQPVPVKLAKIVQSTSAEFLSRFSPDNSPDTDDKTPEKGLEVNFEARARAMKVRPIGRSRSADPVRRSEHGSAGASRSVSEAAAAMINNMPPDLKVPRGRTLHSDTASRTRVVMFDEVKNKPLPKIANL